MSADATLVACLVADQVTDLHLAKAQGDIVTADFPTNLHDTGTLADAAMTDHTVRQVGFGQDFREHLLHLGDIHGNLVWIYASGTQQRLKCWPSLSQQCTLLTAKITLRVNFFTIQQSAPQSPCLARLHGGHHHPRPQRLFMHDINLHKLLL